MTMTSSGVIQGAYAGMRTNAGAPSNGTSEVQTLTIGGTPTAGASSNVKFQTDAGVTSIAALWSATNATFVANCQAALDALLGASNTVVAIGTATAGVGTFTITFAVNLGALNVPLLVAVNNLTGTSPTAVIATTTPGVTATQRGAITGGQLADTTNGVLYVNDGTSTVPVWDSVTVS